MGSQCVFMCVCGRDFCLTFCLLLDVSQCYPILDRVSVRFILIYIHESLLWFSFLDCSPCGRASASVAWPCLNRNRLPSLLCCWCFLGFWGGSENGLLKRVGSQRALLCNRRILVRQTACRLNREPNTVCVVWGVGGEGRKRERERERREMKVIPKHFPLSLHLDVVPGTRRVNVCLVPPLPFFPFL